jgi:hypothetical protein
MICFSNHTRTAMNRRTAINRLSDDESDDRPSQLELTVGLLAKTARLQEFGAAHAMSVRMPLMVFATVRAMAEQSGLSTNRVVVELLRVAIEAVGESLPDVDADNIVSIRSRIVHDLLKAESHDLLREGD